MKKNHEHKQPPVIGGESQKLNKKKLTLPFTEKDLLKNMTPYNAHADLIITPSDCGATYPKAEVTI